MHKCPGCGAELRFDPALQRLICDYCGQSYDPQDPVFSKEEEAHSEQEVGGENSTYDEDKSYQAIVYMCPSCGAKVLATAETAATFCSFCGSNVTLESRLDREARPDVVVPFKVTKEECEKAYRKRLSKALFVPSYIKNDTQIEKFRGIYMPYWIYSFDMDDTVSATGEISHRRGDYIIEEHYRVSTRAQGEFHGISYDASSSFSDAMSEAVAPFDTNEAEPFDTTYLSGFYADLSDVGQNVYETSAYKMAQEYFGDEVYKDYEFSRRGVKRRDVQDSVDLRENESKKGYFPVWFLANRSRDGKYVSYATVNGQNGKVAADIPVSFGKYLIGALLAAIPVGLLLWWFYTASTEASITPKGVLLVMAVMSLIMFFITRSAGKKVIQRANLLNDRGYQSRMKQQADPEEPEEKPKRYHAWKSLIGILLTVIVVFFWSPIGDTWYYFTAFVVIALQIWSVFDLIRLQNDLSRQKPPQFNKRGGDFNA